MTSDTKLNIGPVQFSNWIWLDACQFRDAANTLYDTDHAKYPFVILMNYAFACELALKACAVQTRYSCEPLPNGIFPSATLEPAAHGHKLAEVFDQLPDEVKELVSTAFKNITNTELRPQLVKFQDYFVDVRYSYEKRPRCYDLTGMRDLANALVKAVHSAGTTNNAIRRFLEK